MTPSYIRSPTSSRRPVRSTPTSITWISSRRNFPTYSHNTYQYTPHVNADIAPGHPWVSPTVMLSDPNDYAMVTVSTGTEPGTPQFHCALIVDGKVVVNNDGAKGTLCSLRSW